jgi:histidine triad (HIT) family protein
MVDSRAPVADNVGMAKTLFERIMAREIPANFAHEDDLCIAIHDISPQAPVHLLVIPRKPIVSLNDITPEDAPLVGHLFVVAKQLMHGLEQTDYRTVFNCGVEAGQTVFHLHLHVMAGRSFDWPPG